MKVSRRFASRIFFFTMLLAAVAVRSGEDFDSEDKAGAARVRLVWTNDPSSQASLMWDAAGQGARKVYFGESDFGQDVARYPQSIVPLAPVSFKGMNNVAARLTGLKADAIYYLVIDESGVLSPRFWFRTAPSGGDKRLSLIAGGDSRNNRVPRQNANTLVAKLRPTAVLFGGDYTSSGTDSEWREWMDDWQRTIGADGRLTPIIPTRGNHETSNEIVAKLFDAPATNYFALSIGGALLRVYTLNTESSIAGDQSTWLQRDLAANSDAQWTFVQYHRPMRPHTKSKPEGSEQYRSWAQLFFDQGVDLVVDSDSHLIKSTWPLRPATGSGSVEGFRRDDAAGTVYVGEGGWGAPLRPADDNKEWTRDSASFDHFHWIFVGRDKVEVRAVNTANANEVGQVSDADPFRAPARLNVWNPSHGSVIEIER